MSEIRVGVLGLGQGRSHLRAFQVSAGSRVVAVCDSDQSLAERVAREMDVPRVYADYAQLLADRAVDLIVVATPDHLHGAHTILALEAGKHVLSEIPMTLTLEECRQIIALTDRSGLKYQMGNQVRYAFALQDVARRIAAGRFGELFYGEGEYLHGMDDVVRGRPADHWRTRPERPQTTLLGGGPHAIDTLRWLMGVRFVEAQAYHAAQRTPWGAPHTTVAILRADNGAVAKITVSYGMVRPYCLYYAVYGTAGSFERTRIQGRPLEETINYLADDPGDARPRLTPVSVPNWVNPAIPPDERLGHGTMEIEQARDFLRAIRDDTAPLIGPREAARSIAAGICALQSAEQGGGVVVIPAFD